jgi:short-subunit dehydrogenase
MSALRGMRKSMTTYAATKAGVASLPRACGRRTSRGLDLSVIHPGYIRSEMNEHVQQKTRFMVDTPTGVRGMVAAIEKWRARAYVPAWPWAPVDAAIRMLPLSVVRKLT